MTAILENLQTLIEQTITSLGYPGIALVMLIETVFPPIPSEVIMPFAGFMVAEGHFTFFGIVLAGTIGSVLGATVLYFFGMWLDDAVVRTFIRRFGRWLWVSEHDLDRVTNLFGRYGQSVVFSGRLIPLSRSLISLPAGMSRMRVSPFLIFTTLGTAIWSGVLGYFGMILGDNWEQILSFIDTYERMAVIVLGLVTILLLVTWIVKKRKRASI